jgi:glycosyltransferase involved in cell wall biosynthesis
MGTRKKIIEVSLVLCTHNPRPNYLKAALDSIKAQTLPVDRWELLLVDNASQEKLSGYLDLSWHPNARLVREDELGLTSARLRGIQESNADLLVFLDDDNILSPNYLETALALFQTHQWLGVIGAGNLTPLYEKKPHPKVQKILPLLAIRNIYGEIWSNNPEDAAGIPWGAGICVLRTIALEYVDLVRKLNISGFIGRRGSKLTCGEDDLFSFAAMYKDMGFGVFPELQVTHLISANRVSESYLLQLVEGHGFSHAIIGILLKTSSGKRLGRLTSLRMIFSAARLGLFNLRVELAVQRGIRRAQHYNLKQGLEPN